MLTHTHTRTHTDTHTHTHTHTDTHSPSQMRKARKAKYHMGKERVRKLSSNFLDYYKQMMESIASVGRRSVHQNR